jgi:transcriptional regulator with XRE-family HTH domain
VHEEAVLSNAREQFAENLRRCREKSGLTQEALADACDLHRTEISLLERSRRSPRLETIVMLARALGLSSSGELLEGIN